MQSNLVNFIQVLRSHDVRVSPAESLDAVDVAAKLGYADRSLLRDGLAMTLAKSPDEEAVFLECFDRFFRHNLADFAEAGQENPEESESMQDADSDEASGESADSQESPDGSAAALEMAAENNQELQSLLESSLMQSLMNNDRNATYP